MLGAGKREGVRQQPHQKPGRTRPQGVNKAKPHCAGWKVSAILKRWLGTTDIRRNAFQLLRPTSPKGKRMYVILLIAPFVCVFILLACGTYSPKRIIKFDSDLSANPKNIDLSLRFPLIISDKLSLISASCGVVSQ